MSVVAEQTLTVDRVTALKEELQALTQSGRLDWSRDMTEALIRAGGDGSLSPAQWAEVKWYGVLEVWLNDTTVSDILINGPDREIMIVQSGMRISTGMRAHATWIQFAQRQMLLRSQALNPSAPDAWPRPMMLGTVDRRIRFAITAAPASPDGPTIAIRLLPARWRLLDDFVRDEVLPRAAADLLIEALRCGVSVLIGGSTGSGKTTFASALLQEVAADKRVVIIEEARELPVLYDSVSVEVGNTPVSFADCVYFALRQKPDLIVVGEVRGGEALAMLRAAATGHPGIATIHANDVQSALKNLERMACERGEVPPGIIRGMMTSPAAPMLVCHIGKYGGRRRVGVIEEVIQLGAAGQAGERYPLNTLFQYEAARNTVAKVYPVVGDWGAGRF